MLKIKAAIKTTFTQNKTYEKSNLGESRASKQIQYKDTN